LHFLKGIRFHQSLCEKSAPKIMTPAMAVLSAMIVKSLPKNHRECLAGTDQIDLALSPLAHC
jgi:hypothetical protein